MRVIRVKSRISAHSSDEDDDDDDDDRRRSNGFHGGGGGGGGDDDVSVGASSGFSSGVSDINDFAASTAFDVGIVTDYRYLCVSNIKLILVFVCLVLDFVCFTSLSLCRYLPELFRITHLPSQGEIYLQI